jgi:signal transduction histidine kinase
MKTVSINQLFTKSNRKVKILGVATVAVLAVLGFSYYVSVVSPTSARAFNGAGKGYEDEPYLVTNCAQLQSMLQYKWYALVNDVDCSDTVNWNDGEGFRPLEGANLDGRNYEIKDLYINRPTKYSVGMFANVIPGNEIKNLKLTKSEANANRVDINGARSVGALAGEFRGVRVTNVHSNLNVQSNGRASDVGGDGAGMSVGGLVGINYSTIEKSSSSGNVLVAQNDQPNRGMDAGGLVGASRPIPSEDSNLSNIATISDSFSTGNVIAGTTAQTPNGSCGGFVGSVGVYDSQTIESSVRRSYSTGSISCSKESGGTPNVGGFIGAISVSQDANVVPSINNNFTVSAVNTSNGANQGNSYGFVASYNRPVSFTNTSLTDPDLSSNAFDITRTGRNACSGSSLISCNGVNANNSEPNYFKIDNASGFFGGSWEIGENWQYSVSYPVHTPTTVRSDPPTNLNVVRDGDNFIATWEAPVGSNGRASNIADYQLFYKDIANGGDWTSQQDNYGDNLTATLTGLQIPGRYSFKIRARSVDSLITYENYKNGLYSASLDFATGMPATAPQNIQVTPKSRFVDVSWEAVEGATAYELQYRKAGIESWSNGGVATELTTKIGILDPVTDYEIRVTAKNIAGIGPWSNIITTTTTAQISYNVSNCQQLQDINNDLEGKYTQTADIDCSSVPNFSVIGGASNVFVGSYDGKGFSISNVTISTDVEANDTSLRAVGLFGIVLNGDLQNITLKNSTVLGNYALSASIDTNRDGVPDESSTPLNLPSAEQIGDIPVTLTEDGEQVQSRVEDVTGIAQELTDSNFGLNNVAPNLSRFPRFAVGSVIGAAVGQGNYTNIKAINTNVQGILAGGVVGLTVPAPDFRELISGIQNVDTVFDGLALFNGSMTLDGLQSSGNVNGFVAGGVIGAGVSSLGGLVGLDGELVIKNSSSASVVNANIAGGIIGVGFSPSTASFLPITLSSANDSIDPRGTQEFNEMVNRVTSRQDIIIQDSTVSGEISTCNAPSEVRIGVLGGIVGAATGTLVKNSSSSAQITTCSSAPDLGLSYGGVMGGISGLMISSRIEDSNATGKIKATADGTYGQYDNDSAGYLGSVGGLTGVFIYAGSDADGRYAIKNSSTSGNIEIQGNYALFSLSGGLAGTFIGSGTIKDSYSTRNIYTSTAQKNVGALSISGGLTGVTLGVDLPMGIGIVAQPDFKGGDVQPTHGAVIDNSYATGDVITQKNGKSGMFAVSGGMTGLFLGGGTIQNSYATGAVSSTIPKKFSLGKIPALPTTLVPEDQEQIDQSINFGGEVILGSNYGTAISGGLVGSAYGIDLPLAGTLALTATGLANPDQIKTTQGFKVQNAYATGDVQADVAGGLMGSAELRVQIEKAYAEGNVDAEVAGGLVGQSGLISSAGTGGLLYTTIVIVNGFNGDVGNVQIGTLIDTAARAIGPVEINNTYATGNITATPYAIDITSGLVDDESTVEPKDRIVPVRLPTIAGGLVGLYMDPGGIVKNSYATGSITVEQPPERSQAFKIADIPSFAGGIFGMHIAVPVPSTEKIIASAQEGAAPPKVGNFVASPTVLENVFSTSSLNLTDKTFTGGTSGFFFSPFSALDTFLLGNSPQDQDSDKLYTINNVYFDGSKVKVEGCNGPNGPVSETARGLARDSYIPGEGGTNVIPAIPEKAELPPEYAAIEDLANEQFNQTACQFVNNNNEQPNYFINNKVNAPLNNWNFNDVWIVQKGDYPKFVAQATPGNPTTSRPTTPVTPVTPTPTNFNPAAPGPEATPITGFLRRQLNNFGRVSDEREQVKGLKTYLANVPVFIARSIPYTFILMMLIVASLYSAQALRQYRELSKYHKNILRIITTKESVDNYLAITTHYLNTPVAIMSGSVELLLSLKKITAARADALTNKIKKYSKASEQLLVANQVSGAQAANDEKILKQDQTNPLKVKEVWIPATIALGLITLANALFIYADVFNTSAFRIGIELGLLILSVLLVALAYRYRDYLESTKKLAKEQLKLESELYKKRQEFIPEASKVTTEHLESLKITGKTLEGIPEAKLFFNGLAMLEGINKGLINLKKFAEFSTDPPLFDITAYAKKSVDKFNAKAKEKNVTIESKVDTGLVSRVQPEEIRQLVDSLLENAVKFSNNDSVVSLSIYRRFNKIVIVASDKGVGISEHKLPSLLKPFSRGTDSMQYNYEGIGLGLYTDKIIVDKLGGNISITSKLGEGTTTTVSIPANYSAKDNVPVLVLPEATQA